jgi:hypothetical protein
MKKMMKRYLRVTMEDGSQWDVPVSIIAKNREDSYSKTHDLKDPDNDDLLAISFELADEDEISDWASNDMNWSDVSKIAKKVTSKKNINFEHGWVNGDKEIVEY